MYYTFHYKIKHNFKSASFFAATIEDAQVMFDAFRPEGSRLMQVSVN